jgi:hypothetical protein
VAVKRHFHTRDGGGEPLNLTDDVCSPVPEIRDFFVDEVWNGALARITAYLEQHP